MVWNRAATLLTGAQGVALFLFFRPDGAGKWSRGFWQRRTGGWRPGREQLARLGLFCRRKGNWRDEAAWDGLPGGARFASAEHPICTACGAMDRCLPWNKPKVPSTGQLCCGSSHAPPGTHLLLMEISRTISNQAQPRKQHQRGNRQKLGKAHMRLGIETRKRFCSWGC